MFPRFFDLQDQLNTDSTREAQADDRRGQEDRQMKGVLPAKGRRMREEGEVMKEQEREGDKGR